MTPIRAVLLLILAVAGVTGCAATSRGVPEGSLAFLSPVVGVPSAAPSVRPTLRGTSQPRRQERPAVRPAMTASVSPARPSSRPVAAASPRPVKRGAQSSGEHPATPRVPSKSAPTTGRSTPDPRYGVPWLTRSGIASHMGSGYPSGYLALPHGPGWRAHICGAGGCVTMTSNDAGPALFLQRQGRIADLSVAVFQRVCGVPASAGLCPVSVTILGRN